MNAAVLVLAGLVGCAWVIVVTLTAAVPAARAAGSQAWWWGPCRWWA